MKRPTETNSPDCSGRPTVSMAPSFLAGVSQTVLAFTLAACNDKPEDTPTPRVEAVVVQKTPSPTPKEAPPWENTDVSVNNWNYEATNTQKVRISDDKGQSLYKFIKTALDKNGTAGEFPSEEDGINAIIVLARKENPGVNLDNFLSIVDTSIILPSQMDLSYRSTKTFSDLATLDRLATYDGFDVDNGKGYDPFNPHVSLLKYTIPGLYQHGTDNPVMGGAALDQFADAGARFTESTKLPTAAAGWSLAYTETLRDPQYPGDVHFTGLAVNVCANRFKNPAGEEITWADNTEERSTITTFLRPAEVRALLSAGAAVRDQVIEGGFYDAYFPIEHHVEVNYGPF